MMLACRAGLVAACLLAAVSLPSAEPEAAGPKTSEVTDFVGTWAIEMTNPAGARETVRVWDEAGRAKASVQAGRFPPLNASGILRDGDALILTATRFENGQPIRAVIALTRDGDTMKMAQMLEHSETIKRGSGRKTEGGR
jgi:hypothetical protein